MLTIYFLNYIILLLRIDKLRKYKNSGLKTRSISTNETSKLVQDMK